MERTPRWYKSENQADAANLINTDVRKILQDLAARRDEDRLYLDIINNRDPSGNDGSTSVDDTMLQSAIDGRVRYNLIRSIVNTLRAHLGALDLQVKCVTNGALWSQIRRAKDFELFIGSIADDNSLLDLVKQIFTDAGAVPIGAIKVLPDDGRIKLERVHPEEVLVDVDEGYYGKPRTMYQIKRMSRDDLLEMFEDTDGAEEIIERGDHGSVKEAFSWLPGYSLGEDQVQVVEAWRLPRRKGGEYLDGKHCICTTAGVLVYEDYPIPTFPIVIYRWEKRSFGFYGMSLAEDLRQAHETVRYYDVRIADAMYTVSRIKMIGPEGSKVSTLNDDPVDFYEYPMGMDKPEIWAPNVIPSEIVALRANAIEEARMQVGINDLMQMGERPAGVNAAVALRELQDQSSQRFKDKVQEVEKFYLDVARQIIRTAVWMDQNGELKPVRAKVSKGRRLEVKKIKFREINMDDEEYWLEMTPASALPKSTAARQQTIGDWLVTGLIDINEARELMGFPDIDKFTSMKLSSYHEALDKIEEIVEDGKYTPPEAIDDLSLQHKLGLQAYHYYRRLGLEPEHLELLLQMSNESRDLLDRAMAAVQTGQVASMPQGVPAMPALTQNATVGQPMALPAAAPV